MFVFIACGGQAVAQRAIEFEGRYWMPTAKARVRFDRGGTDINLKQDLGIQDANFPEGRLSFYGRGRSHLHFSYTPVDYLGEAAAGRTIVFGGKQYTVGTRVLSEFELQHFQLGWAYQFVNISDGAFKLGPAVAAHGFLMRGRLKAPDLSPPVDQQAEIAFGLPTVGLAIDINPHRKVNLFTDISGLKVGDYGYFVTSDSGVKIQPSRVGFFTVGYRTYNLHVRIDPDFARFTMGGIFVGGGARF